jgi:CRP/FNR family transcriptional regulator, cyclic AMP receptor protein
MSDDQKIEALSKTELFAGCSDSQVKAIAGVTEWVTAKEGQTLLTEGNVGHDLFVVVSGSAAVQVGGKTIAMVAPGGVVGELSLVDGKRSSATIIAEAGFEAWLVSRRGFLPILEADPGLARPLLDAVVAKLRATDELLH